LSAPQSLSFSFLIAPPPPQIHTLSLHDALPISREPLIRNQYGASVGGRIVRNRAFFFVNWEDRKDRSAAPKARTAPSQLPDRQRSEEHTSELQSLTNLVCPLLLEKKKPHNNPHA